jgi:hypothetical protein
MEGINSLFASSISMPDENLPENFLATVGAVYDDGLSLILEGQTEATTKHYKCNTSATFAAGDRVKVARISGSYIVEYVVGPPGSGGTTETPYAIQRGSNGIFVHASKNMLVPMVKDMYIGATDKPVNLAAKYLYMCYNNYTRAEIYCNNAGKLVVNGTVIG